MAKLPTGQPQTSSDGLGVGIDLGGIALGADGFLGGLTAKALGKTVLGLGLESLKQARAADNQKPKERTPQR